MARADFTFWKTLIISSMDLITLFVAKVSVCIHCLATYLYTTWKLVKVETQYAFSLGCVPFVCWYSVRWWHHLHGTINQLPSIVSAICFHSRRFFLPYNDEKCVYVCVYEVFLHWKWIRVQRTKHFNGY